MISWFFDWFCKKTVKVSERGVQGSQKCKNEGEIGGRGRVEASAVNVGSPNVVIDGLPSV